MNPAEHRDLHVPAGLRPYEGQRREIVKLREAGFEAPASVWHALRHLTPASAREALVTGILKTLRDAKSYTDNIDSATAPKYEHVVVVFAARRMACLYYPLRNAGIATLENTLNQERLTITTDRFILLKDIQEHHQFTRSKIMLSDDTYVTGAKLKKLANAIQQYQSAQSKPNQPSHIYKRAHILATDDSSNGAGINMAHNATPDKADAAELQAGLALTLAEACVPFFTDFPISNAISIEPELLQSALSSIDPIRVDVSNAAIGSQPHYNYSTSLEDWIHNLQDDDLKQTYEQISRLSHIVKLRTFTSEDSEGKTNARLMVKIILKQIDVRQLEILRKELGIYSPEPLSILNEDEPKDVATRSVTEEIAKQLFGYLEYLLADLLFSKLSNHLSNILTGSDSPQESVRVEVDQELASFVLGQRFARHEVRQAHQSVIQRIFFSPPQAGNSLTSTLDTANHFKTPDPTLTSSGASDRILFLGDSTVKLVDSLFRDQVKKEKERHAVLFTFPSLLATFEKDRLPYHVGPVHLSTNYIVSLCLDGLNDSGRIVPAQTLIRDGKYSYVSRGYGFGESSRCYTQLAASPTGGRLMRIQTTQLRTIQDDGKITLEQVTL